MPNDHPRLTLKFWGVRGSLPTPQQENLGYGGNTPCLEVRLSSGEIFVFDAGSGIRDLGKSLLEEFGEQMTVNIFLTHYHWDHLQGIPFFAPLFHPDAHLVFHGQEGLTDKLVGQMEPPYFPIRFQEAPAQKSFIEVSDEPLHFGGLIIRPFPLRHPQGCLGYRLEYQDAVIVYATDFEHGDSTHDRILRGFCDQADILIYDSQFTPEEYKTYQNWGHSTWLEATRVATDSQVKHLVLFHHDPSHDDRFMDAIVEAARKEFPSVTAAREATTISI
jgi:phosphoribosyl 1,2-cyclic phosphodiesterase